MNSLCQIHSVSRKIAEDVGKELERSASCHQQEMRFYEKRAQGSRVVAVALERKPKELRQEQDRNRQMLAKVESNFQPFPRGSCAPAVPPRAHRGPELPGEPPGHEDPQAGEGPHPEGSETWGYLQGGLRTQQPGLDTHNLDTASQCASVL
ncbi:hypothetical protein MJG53_000560 [Ovis ammon polii x Ovis aries]|uniref:Uncharacterized protein n=1 Tax=Ovis ammon polii x Ovis aries TaxID=2918886 RepID=A0ACB9VIE9_9CETA|nr:hypothetical protein MJG53_000560 [Ovis ammon polii x Ovis aries]